MSNQKTEQNGLTELEYTNSVYLLARPDGSMGVMARVILKPEDDRLEPKILQGVNGEVCGKAYNRVAMFDLDEGGARFDADIKLSLSRGYRIQWSGERNQG